MPGPPDNAEIAEALERVADLLEAQDADGFRVRAYRAGAATLRRLPEPAVAVLQREGRKGLEALPGIGARLASLVDEYAHQRRLALLDRLEGQTSPEDLFTTVPGIGDELAARIHRELGVETLEELELAAHDGRLETVPGFGARRVRGVRDALAGMLARSSRRRARRQRWLESRGAPPPGAGAPPQAGGTGTPPQAGGAGARAAAGAAHPPGERPTVETLLAVDEEYRRRAAADELRTIAPRRFNPEGRSWLPVLHTTRDGWEITALFSNTARAHELGRTRDWVVLYWERDGHEDQCTVVTERRGALAGRRVVRGREAECARRTGPRDAGMPAQPS